MRPERNIPRARGESAPAARMQRSPGFASLGLVQRVIVRPCAESAFSNWVAAHCACGLPATGSLGSSTSDTPLTFAAGLTPAPRIADEVAVLINCRRLKSLFINRSLFGPPLINKEYGGLTKISS